MGFGLSPALITGKVDAALGAFWNYEGVDLRLRGQAAADHPHREGRRADLQRARPRGERGRPEVATPTRSAPSSGRSHAERAICAATPSSAIQGLLKANPDLDPKLQRASVAVTLPLFFPPEGKPFGWQDPSQWDEFSAWMKENQLLENAPDLAASFKNDLLPGTGL